MMRTIKILLLFFFCTVLFGRCKDKYVSPYPNPVTGYLVVEGYITGNGPTQFSLSRTIPLSGTSVIPAETGAQVQVEGDNNSTYPLFESGAGQYGTDTLPLNPAAKYRLRITTQDGKTYLSDYVAFRTTPLIDSINWTQNASGVDIYANTHDVANTTGYYQWQFNETWEYHSAAPSYFKYISPPDSIIDRPDTELIYTCWKSAASTKILLGSSAKLAQDVIYLQPIEHIAANTQPLAQRYSILVRQYSLTEEAYNFLTLMQKNTESLGSIFDAQPSALKGNIHSLSDANEQVIGFVSVGTVQQKRIFISVDQVKDWRYSYGCPAADTVVRLDKSSLNNFYGANAYTPITEHFPPPDGPQDGWTSNLTTCIDCRLQGGTNIKPSYWPN